MTITAEDVLARGCGITVNDWAEPVPEEDQIACGGPVAALLTFVCVHEHLDQALACVTCTRRLQRERTAGHLICPRCADGPEPHECPCAMRAEWLT